MKEKTNKKTKPKEENSVYTCPHCHKNFGNASNWHSHVKLHSTEEPYHCELCDYKCKVKKYLTRHIKKAHTKPTDHQCPVCSKCFHFHCKLRDHMRVHTGEKPFKCDVCDKAFSSPVSLNGHKLIHTGEKPFQCQYCDYACRDRSSMKRHEDRHLGIIKDYICSICNKIFKKKETLQIHVDEVHFELNTRKHPCEQCEKVFKTKGTLTMHVKTVHKKVNRIKCEICGVATTKNNLQAHMRRHIDVKPYKCSYKPCGKRFKDKGDLRRHLRIHFPDNQHVCSLCSRRFARRFRLTKHMLNGCRVQCHHCGQLFSAKKYLAQHIKNAHGPYPKSREYLCDICDMVTYSRRGIIQHLKYGHGTEKDTECQICKKDYFKCLTLKEHYLSHHNLKYTLLDEKKEVEVPIKEEPVEELEEVVGALPRFMYEVDIQKQEVNDMEPLPPSSPLPCLRPPSPEHFTVDSDTITYSKKVLSEDISRSLIERDRMQEDAFDDFFIGHVLKKPEKMFDMPKQIVDEKKKECVEKRLEKLLTEVRIRNQYVVLEKLRKQYNRRIKMATGCGNKKEQTSIRYFKKTENNNETIKPQKETNNDEQIRITNNDENINNQETDEKKKNLDSEKENDEMIDNDNINDEDIAEKNDDDESNDEASNDEKDNDEDSDFEVSDAESNPNGKLKFNTHQCYICFKLFKTKTDLKRHCKHHFDICNEKMLKKCPFCGYVTNLQITRHIKLVHKMSLDIPYGRIKEKDTQNGSKYVFEIDKNCDLEIIPSISNLNKIASMKIDEKNRASRNIFLGTTKLIKKGEEWMVAKQAVNINNEYLLPEFNDDEYQMLKSVGDNYLERIRSLSILAKKKGLKMLYPCEGCDKICLTLSALKLHNRKHETNPKRFKPKVWKNKILNGLDGRYRHVNKKSKNRKNIVENNEGSSVNNQGSGKSKKLHGKLEVITKNDTESVANRFADPNPVKNKHKCDKQLIEFYKENIKGGDIEFWHFLKIFNRMSRENVNDFKDLENRHDFGMHNIINYAFNTENSTEIKKKDTVENISVKPKNNRVKSKKQAFTRAIMISKKEYLKRLEIIKEMRQKLKIQN